MDPSTDERRHAAPGDIDALREACQKEALRASFPIDTEVYQAAGRDPLQPILFGGRLDTPLCIFARDLGREEVHAGEPLKGAGGRLVRTGIYRHCGGTGTPADTDLRAAADRVLLTNTVPYKPPGNKAYSEPVKERFRPFLLELLVAHFRGDTIITLGTEAFLWFASSAAPGEIDAFWKRKDERYQQSLAVTLRSGARSKQVTVMPLPHPSPLNQTYYSVFPQMLARRLAQLDAPLCGERFAQTVSDPLRPAAPFASDKSSSRRRPARPA